MKLLLVPLLAQLILAPNPERMAVQAHLNLLPPRAVLPARVPDGFALSDVRIHQHTHARWGAQLTYSLVYTSATASFMLQSQLPGYHPLPDCQQHLKWRSAPGLQVGTPRRWSLYSPACHANSVPFETESLAPEQVTQIQHNLAWFRRKNGVWTYHRALN